MQAIHKKDVQYLEDTCGQLERNNIDLRTLLKQLAELIQQTACLQLQNKSGPLTELWPKTYIQVLYHMLIQGIQDLDYSPSARIGTLMCLIRMSVFYPESTPTPIPSKPATTSKKASTSSPTQSCASWEETIQKLEVSAMIKALLANCALSSKDNNHWQLILKEQHKHMLTDSAPDKTAKALSSLMNQDIKVSITLGNETLQTPADNKKAQQSVNQKEAEQSLSEDPVLNSLLSSLNVNKEDVTIS